MTEIEDLDLNSLAYDANHCETEWPDATFTWLEIADDLRARRSPSLF